MSRRRQSSETTPFDSMKLEGSLFVPELLERAASGGATFQKETDYAIPKGLKLHDEYGRAFRIATALWQDLAAQMARTDLDATKVTRSFVTDLLSQCLAYNDLTVCPAPLEANGEAIIQNSTSKIQHSDSRAFPITAMACGGHIPVIIAPHNLGLDDPDPHFAIIGSSSKKKSAHQLAQEFLNASPGCLWAIVTNGRTLRLLRDAETLTRPNFLEFDLETILRESEGRYADFSALWRILHSSRASSAHCSPITDHSALSSCIWEKWKSEGHAQGLRVRDGLRDGVTEAILILGRGFLAHPDNTVLRQRLHDGSLTLDDYFQQFFRLIYRCLFLFCTEERDLLHAPDSTPAARQAYATGYSLRRFRKRSLRQSAHDPHGDLWQSVRIVFRGLAGGQPRLALPALGGLFAETQCPDLDSAALSNRDLLAAMRELRWFFDKKTGKRSAIDYRNMGTEELGSVYESLLELVPTIDLPARSFGFVGLTDEGSTAGNARKTTGSYYTADPLVMELIKSALEPVIRQRLADARELAASPWITVAARIATDSTQRSYVHAWMVKQLAVSMDASPEAFARAWDAIPAEARANPLCIEALLSITVCDPSCGSGHFLLAAARRLAERLAELRAPDGAVRPDDYRHALREVAGRCLFGVDINPMAVELCRVALWLETVDPGKPLGFLDHHIRCGNSLLGTTPDLIAQGLPDDTFKAIEGDDKKACAELKKRNKKERQGFGPLFEKEEQEIRDSLRQAATAIEEMDDSQPELRRQKEAAFLTSESSPEHHHAQLLADLWCAAFVIKKIWRDDTLVVSSPCQSQIPNLQSPLPSPEEGQLLHSNEDLFGQSVSAAKSPAKPKSSLTTEQGSHGTPVGITTATLRSYVQTRKLSADLESEVSALASQYRFFHWHLAFPQVFARGGFDCMLGNPPWEQTELKEKEWFASRRPEIAEASNAAVRKKLISSLFEIDPKIYHQFTEELRGHDGLGHMLANSGAYPLCGCGRINLYAVFAECMRTKISNSGRVGCIVQSDIATGDTSKAFFGDLISTGKLVSLFDFVNTEGLFPAIHRTHPHFCLLTISGKSVSESVDFSFWNTNAGHLLEIDRHFALSANEINLINPNTGTCPIFRSKQDAELTKLIYRRVAVLLREGVKHGNPWDVRISRMLNGSDDAHLFLTSPSQQTDLRVYESKFFWQFDHRHASVTLGNVEVLESNQKKLPDVYVSPQYYVSQDNLPGKFHSKIKDYLLSYRVITNTTNERTFVATILPRCGLINSANSFYGVQGKKAALLLANLNSFVLDFLSRQAMGGANLHSYVVQQLAILDPLDYSEPSAWGNQPHILLRDWLLPRVLELTYTAWDLEAFASDCGWSGPPFRWDEDRRFLLRCELDAAFFHLYLGTLSEWHQQPEALTRAFPTPRHAVSYIMDTFPIVKRKDIAKHGTYRTQETILQIYDALNESMASGVAYQTSLHPLPATLAAGHPWSWRGMSMDLPEEHRSPLPQAYQYVVSVMIEMVMQAGGVLSWTKLKTATDLLTDREKLAKVAKPILGEVTDEWLKLAADSFDATLRFDQLSGLCFAGRMAVTELDDELVVELLTLDKHVHFPHVRFDARIALALAETQMLEQPISIPVEERRKLSALISC